jgi:hypothetical protein
VQVSEKEVVSPPDHNRCSLIYQAFYEEEKRELSLWLVNLESHISSYRKLCLMLIIVVAVGFREVVTKRANDSQRFLAGRLGRRQAGTLHGNHEICNRQQQEQRVFSSRRLLDETRNVVFSRLLSRRSNVDVYIHIWQ